MTGAAFQNWMMLIASIVAYLIVVYRLTPQKKRHSFTLPPREHLYDCYQYGCCCLTKAVQPVPWWSRIRRRLP